MKKVIRISICMCVMLILTACQEKVGKELESTQKQEEKLEERKINLPENLLAVTDICTPSAGVLRVGGTIQVGEAKVVKVWESKNKGVIWDEVLDISTIPGLADVSADRVELTLSNTGIIVLHFFAINGIGGSSEVYIMDPEQKVVKMPLEQLPKLHVFQGGLSEGHITENGINRFKFSQEGVLFGEDLNGQIHKISTKNGLIQTSYGEKGKMGVNDEIRDFAIVEENLVIVKSSKTIIYDGKTGEKVKEEKALHQVIKEKAKTILSMKEMKNGKLVFISDKGLFSYNFQTEQIKILLEMDNMTIENQFLFHILPVNEAQYYIAGQMMPDSPTSMSYYASDKEESYEKTIRVYTLKDTKGVRTMIGNCRRQFPTTNFQLEVGITEEDGITRSDAIRKLNTELAAKKGPDILLLDDMEIAPYIEKNMLQDISGILKQGIAEGAYFEHIVRAYEKNNGIYAVPLTFSIPIAAGEKEWVENAGGMKELEEAFKKERKNKENIIFEDLTVSITVAEALYQASAGQWIGVDKRINKEAIRTYYKNIEHIRELGKYEEINKEKEIIKEYWVMAGNLVSIAKSKGKLLLHNVQGWHEVELLYYLKNQESAPYSGINNKKGGIFVPQMITAINSNATDKEHAMQVMQYLCSDAGQEIGEVMREIGFPIRKLAIRNYYESQLEKGKRNEDNVSFITVSRKVGENILEKNKLFDILYLTPKEGEEFIEFADSLTVKAKPPEEIEELVLTEAIKCLDKKQTAEGAAKKVVQQLELSGME